MEDDSLIGLALADAKDKMVKAVGHAREEFSAVRTGRASPALVERIRIDYYGSDVPLRDIAGINAPEPRLLVITPYDKGSSKAIEKALRNSDLGINPGSDGQVIRLSFPPLTEERRKELVKVVRHKAEEAKVAVRNLRRATRHDLDGLEKEGEITSDELDRAEKDLEKVTQDQVADIERLLAHKEQELLEV